jgi:hypothetical protein
MTEPCNSSTVLVISAWAGPCSASPSAPLAGASGPAAGGDLEGRASIVGAGGPVIKRG